MANDRTVEILLGDAALLVNGWRAKTGLKHKAGIDPADVDRAMQRVTNAIVDRAVEAYRRGEPEF